jgi:hypothetical protein
MEGCKEMKSKASWLYLIIPIILLTVSISIMTSGYWWKKSEASKEILALVQNLENEVYDEKWDQANKTIVKTTKKWEQNIKIIQYGVERDRIFEIDESLAKIQGAILTKNTSGAMQEVYVFYRIWDDLGY